MSAMRATCPACGARYMAGVVGSTPWPAHKCPTEEQNELRGVLIRLQLHAPHDIVTEVATKVRAVVERLQVTDG